MHLVEHRQSVSLLLTRFSIQRTLPPVWIALFNQNDDIVSLECQFIVLHSFEVVQRLDFDLTFLLRIWRRLQRRVV